MRPFALLAGLLTILGMFPVTALGADLPVDDTEDAALIDVPCAQPCGDELDRMIGQMIMVGFQGESVTDPWPGNLVQQIAAGRVGGVLFLQRNARSREAVESLTTAFREAAKTAPVLLAVDQEGGRVQRLREEIGFTERPSAHAVAETYDPLEAEALYAGLAEDLRDWNFNVNFGPVVDVDVNPDNPIIGSLGRSFSSDPDTVTAYGRAFVRGHHAKGMLTALKHFPGHGSSRADSHKTFVDISGSWSAAELKPFEQLIRTEQVDMVMVGHLYLDRFNDPGDDFPATLSRKAIGVLRNDLGFDGVVVSDDMEMYAIEKHYSLEQAAIGAIEAGNNILIYSNYLNPRMDLPEQLLAIIKRRAVEDAGFRSLVENSYKKIMTLKQKLVSGKAS